MLIMSMDSNKAFDGTEPSFLFQTLEAMGFGEKFTQYVKTLFNSPKPNILTNYILSVIIQRHVGYLNDNLHAYLG